MKGDLNQECNRSACKTTPANFYNHSTKMHYCSNCAELINNQNRLDALRLYGHDLCTEVTEDQHTTPDFGFGDDLHISGIY